METFAQMYAKLAEKAHAHMMQKGMHGDYSPMVICGVKVTCADDLQSVRNRFSQYLRSVSFDEIRAEIGKLS